MEKSKLDRLVGKKIVKVKENQYVEGIGFVTLDDGTILWIEGIDDESQNQG